MTLTSSGSPGAASGRIGGASPAHPNGRESLVARLDWVLLAAVAGLGIIGSALVWSATRPRLLDAGLDPEQLLRRHLLNIAIGVVLGTAVALFDHRMLRAYAPVIYALSIVGLVAVLSPLGSTINGSQSWIVLPGGFSVQPAEFAKVALVIGLAMLLAEKRDTETEPRSGDILLALLFAAVPIGLVMLQPDLGTTVVLGAIVVGMLAVCGAPKKLLAGLAVVGVLVCVAAVRLDVLDDYQIARFTSFTNPGADLAGTGYNANQARIAIGSGGLTGTGLFEGTQTNGKFVPEQQTDFIFTVAGEELGFVGGAAVILLLGVVLWRALRIASRAEDLFGTLVAVGVACWFAFQAFENIGMTLGIMPVTGVPLPFVSYGGSSMFASMMAVGLLQNVHLRRYT